MNEPVALAALRCILSRVGAVDTAGSSGDPWKAARERGAILDDIRAVASVAVAHDEHAGARARVAQHNKGA